VNVEEKSVSWTMVGWERPFKDALMENGPSLGDSDNEVRTASNYRDSG
jgi:hypothetical protein